MTFRFIQAFQLFSIPQNNIEWLIIDSSHIANSSVFLNIYSADGWSRLKRFYPRELTASVAHQRLVAEARHGGGERSRKNVL